MILLKAIYHKMSESWKQGYKKGIMSLIGSRHAYKMFVLRAHDMFYQLGMLTIAFFVFAGPCYVYTQMGRGASLMVQLASNVFLAIGCMICLFDLDVLDCYLRGYKQSSYYLATKEEMKNITRHAGLIGEFKSYVLSRSLKVPHRTLHNVCVPMRNGNFQEVDTVIITRNIIYVVECKNRGGDFIGTYDQKKWKHRIGKIEEDVENIYLQNQGHTMAIDQFLLDRGIIKNGQNVCINALLATGDMTIPTENMPFDFVAGGPKPLKKYIEENDKNFDDGTDTSGIMEQIFDALLPYSLYTNEERAAMMGLRKVRSESKEFAVGEFQVREINDTFLDASQWGEKTLIRSNRLYTQIQVDWDGDKFWQTRTDIGKQMKPNPDQISKGVGRDRIEAYKKALVEEPKLVLKKAVWIALGVSAFIMLAF